MDAIRNGIERLYEIAFGDDAFNKGYTILEVADKCQEFSNKALAWDNFRDTLDPSNEADWEIYERMSKIEDEINATRTTPYDSNNSVSKPNTHHDNKDV